MTFVLAVHWTLKFVIVAGAVVVAGILWSFIRRRLAPRTIDSWSGEGIHESLTPMQASVLLRAHPTLTVALAMEGLFAGGRATITSTRPLRLSWPDPDAQGPVEDAIAHALGGGDTIEPEGVCAILETVYESVDSEMEEFSGRLTVLHYRALIRSLWNGLIAGDPVTAEQRPWILLSEAAQVGGENALVRTDELWERMQGEDGDVIHDLYQLKKIFRIHLIEDVELEERARGATSGYFRWRKDLPLPGRLAREQHYIIDAEARSTYGASPRKGRRREP